uniref:Uncharacterized protein n=1 Tax=Osmundaria fimbriata TaxID=228265 RepID=A0A1Z1M4G4_OSMFI|nr:hypothetical protein [Osmundaria fimbriata]ARW60812.1 hypothetical protein [Osmundaria fimbriata]
MDTKFNTLLNSFQGKWFSQTNTYLLNSKKHKKYRKKIIVLIKNKYINIYSQSLLKLYSNNVRLSNQLLYKNINITNNQTVFSGNLTNITKQKLNFKLINKNSMKMESQFFLNDIIYEEYLYQISHRFIISIGFLKSLSKFKYIGVTITSYIKI